MRVEDFRVPRRFSLLPLIAAGLVVLAAPNAVRAEIARDTDLVVLQVLILDEDEIDYITVRHAQGCGPVSGVLSIDFTASQGGVLIDTRDGGPGDRYAEPVQVTEGPGVIFPVRDGARNLDVALSDLQPGQHVRITLDMDKETGLLEEQRIVARPADLIGTLIGFTAQGQPPQAVPLGPTGLAHISLPAGECGTPGEAGAVPIAALGRSSARSGTG